MKIFYLIVHGPEKNLKRGVMAKIAEKGRTLGEISLSILDRERPILKLPLCAESSQCIHYFEVAFMRRVFSIHSMSFQKACIFSKMISLPRSRFL